MADFSKSLRTALSGLAARHKISEDKAFAVLYGIEAFRLSEEEALEAASYDGGNDRGIDFFLVDDEWERVVIAQFKNLKNVAKAPKLGDLALLLDTLDELEEPQELLDAGRNDLAEAAGALEEARANGYSVQLHFVYPGGRRPIWNAGSGPSIARTTPTTSAPLSCGSTTSSSSTRTTSALVGESIKASLR